MKLFNEPRREDLVVLRPQTFNALVERRSDVTFVRLLGVIDEHAQFPTIATGGMVVVHLRAVTSINSVGARAWLGWVQRLGHDTRVQLEECPVVFVKSFNLVRGFLSDNARVASFFVPYFSERTGERRDVLAVRGTHFTDDGAVRLTPPVDSAGQPMEIDVIEDAYYAFLAA